MFHGAHSLGGGVLQKLVEGDPDISAGLILLGTYLPGELTADFTVPVLTAVGSLDAGVMPYVRLEAEENSAAENEFNLPGRLPVLIIDSVNHAQVSGAGECS